MHVPAAALARVRELYLLGRYRQALAAGEPFGPLRGWAGPAARLMAGRLAIQLGGPRLGRRLHLVAVRESPGNLEAVYYHARYRVERFGPLAGWRYLRQHPDWTDASPELRSDWLALHAFVFARLRDFDRADQFIAKAESAGPPRPWLDVEKAAVYDLADRLPDALASARAALDKQAWFRPAVQAVGHVLTKLGREGEAVEFLEEACDRLESGIVVAQLATLHLDRHRPADARRVLDRYPELSPLMEPEVARWLAARRADVAYLLGDKPTALAAAREVGEDFYPPFADRLEAATEFPARKTVPVDLDGPPAGMTSPFDLLAKFWNQPAVGDPLPPPDGLPDAAERRRFDAAGWRTHEFRLTPESAAAVLDRGLPFVVTLLDAGFGQPRLAVGYDPLRGTLLVVDGVERRPAEAPFAALAERYPAFGPRCLLAVPADQEVKLAGLDLPDAAEYDRLYAVQSAVLDRSFAAAKDALAAMPPGHRLTKFAAVAWARATGHPVKLLDAITALRADYAADPGFVLTQAAALRDLGRVADRLTLLEDTGGKLDSEPLLMQSLAQMLLPDPNRQGEATRLLRRSVRVRPHAPAGYYLLASQLWEQQEFAAGTDVYRMAAALDDREEQFTEAYFRAAQATEQAPDALRLFQQKATRTAVPVPAAVRALFAALLDRDEAISAFAALDRAIDKLSAGDHKPALGELLLYRAERHADFGRPEQADADLAAAKPLVPVGAFHRTAARVARVRPDFAAALGHVREWLRHEPLAPDAHRLATALIADTEGRAAAKAYLANVCQRYPDFHPAMKLRAEFLYPDHDDATVAATQALIDACPTDAWAYRQLALVYADRRQHADALAAITRAGDLDPDHPSHFAVLAHVHRRADRTDDALSTLRAGVRKTVDHDALIAELVQQSRGAKEKRAALKLVFDQLRTQPHTGDGVTAYFEQSMRVVDDPEDQERLFTDLERLLDARPDLWQCWSAVIQLMVLMHREDEAIAVAKDATERFPLVARLWADRAEAHGAAGQTDDRIEALHRAVAVTPGWTPTAKELADTLAETGDEAKAVEVLEQLVPRAPLDPLARGFLAERLWQAGRSREALDHAKAALRLEPGYDWAWGAVMSWSDRLDEPQEAVELARALTRDRAGDPRAWLRLARTLGDPDQADEVLAALEKAITLDPANVEAHDLKAERLAQMGRFDDALAAAKPPALVDDLPLVLQGRAAWVEARRGNYPAAIPPMQALVSVDPEYIWGWQQLAEWYNDTGRSESYLEAASQLVRLRPDHPMSLTLRGEARLQTGDRENGKADLREALRIHPAYSAAAVILFDACLADEEFRDARSALAVLQEHLAGPEVLVKQVQYAAKTGDPEAAGRAFADICRTPGEGPPLLLQMAMVEMQSAGWKERAEAELKAAWQSGEPFHPWVVVSWLDTPDGEAADSEERLAACDAVLRDHPGFVPALDRKAEQLAADGRFDEAIAACDPPTAGKPTPVALRGRRAWIEFERGDKAKAIALMRQVVADEPDYSWGWRQLTQWFDLTDRRRECLEAADQLVRLNPADPLAVAIRGEAKKGVGDHRGAVADFARAFDLDPAFEAAGLQLVSAHLATDDVTAAAAVVEKLRETAAGPLVELRAVQVAARQKDLSAARASLRKLAADPDITRGVLRDAVRAMAAAGWADAAGDDLLAAIVDDTGTAAAAAVWAESAAAWKVADQLPRVVAANPAAGREAVLIYAHEAADTGRPDATAATVQRFADLLRADVGSWARGGAALLAGKHHALAASWLADWKDREDVEPWMLVPLATSLRALDRDAEADAVIRDALALDGDPADRPAEFVAWPAVVAAVQGDVAAARAHLRDVDPVGLSDGVRLLLAIAEAVLMVRQAGPAGKGQAFAEAVEHLKTAAGACAAADVEPGTGRWYRRAVARIAADAGGLRALWWRATQAVAPWVRGG